VFLAPPSEEALVINLGDFFHSDSSENRTAKSGHSLDVDGRWHRVLQVGYMTMVRCIEFALAKHQRVRVINAVGNHDTQSSHVLAVVLAAWFRNNERVSIDTTPGPFYWHRFGKNLLGVHHGDLVKPAELPSLMASDRAQDWGATEHRFWYCGHIHHEVRREYRGGVIVESFRTLAARDAWHHGQGYRSGRDMNCDVLHKDHGRIGRHTIGVSMLRSGAK
jgi:hypothetical protein